MASIPRHPRTSLFEISPNIFQAISQAQGMHTLRLRGAKKECAKRLKHYPLLNQAIKDEYVKGIDC